MMRIAEFHNISYGGAKRTHAECVKRLAEKHEVDVYNYSRTDESLFDITKYGKNVYTIQTMVQSPPILPFLFSIMEEIRASKLIAKEIDKRGYDVVLATHSDNMSPMLLRYLHTPAVYYCHNLCRGIHEKIGRGEKDVFDNIRRKFSNRILGYLERKTIECADVIVVNSYYSREYMYLVLGITPLVNYFGIDSALFRPLNLERENFVLCVGRIEPLKAHDFVLRSIAHIEKEKRPKFVIVADSYIEGEMEKVIKLARSLGVNLEIKVRITDEELISLYNKARVVAYAPIMENFGLVPLEAMACETPVVGVKEAGIRETIRDGETGILVDRSERDFGNAIERVMEDDELARTLGKKGREEVVKNWTWERSVKKIERILQECAETHRARK